MQKLLTVQEAAEHLRVSRSTIWRWCRDGTLSSAFKIGRNWRIHRSEVEEILGLYSQRTSQTTASDLLMSNRQS
jgi:excisionase family DNA binding protein